MPGMPSGFVSFGAMAQRELPLHRNVGMEVVYIAKGRLRWVVDGHAENVNTGDVFYTLPWQVHGSVHAREPGNRIVFIQFRLDRRYERAVRTFAFAPELDVPARAARRLSRLFCRTRRHAWRATPGLTWLITRLADVLEAGGAPLLCQGLLRALLAELAEVVAGRVRVPRPALDASTLRVRHLATAIEAGCGENWPLARMLALARLRKSRLLALFRQETGDSPRTFLHRARIARAEALLAGTTLSVTQIADACGYATTQLFCRTFRRFTNRTPLETRRRRHAGTDPHVLEFSARDERERLRRLHNREWL